MLAPTPPPLAYGPWQARFGQADSQEHYASYLQDSYYAYPFGQLPAEEGLPAAVAGQPLSCGLVDELLTEVLRKAAWVQQIDAVYPPEVESHYPVACLAYFGHTLRITYDVDGRGFDAELTVEKVLRGFALALPFWPGQFGIYEPVNAAGAMRQLLNPDTTEFSLHLHPTVEMEFAQDPHYILNHLYAWAHKAVQYALFDEVRYQ